MNRRFTVIAGGVSGAEGGSDANPWGWRIELKAVEAVTSDIVTAWRALLTRSGEQEPHFADPDYVLPAARHRASGSNPAVALAWGQRQSGSETLHGVFP